MAKSAKSTASKRRPATPVVSANNALQKALTEWGNEVVFWVNGTRVAVANPDPRLVLVDYLRSPDVGMTGTKIGCKEGGCGACTIMISHFDLQVNKVIHAAYNSCLRPVATLDGSCITTIEGLGSVQTQLNEWQDKIAAGNGSQCGYCTPGFVMAMCATACAKADLTPAAIEECLDGNICRCTGYRPILRAFGATAGKSAISPVVRKDDGIHPQMMRLEPRAENTPLFRPKGQARFEPRVPKEAVLRARHPKPLAFKGQFGTWFRPTTLEDAFSIKSAAGMHGFYVQGNTSTGIFARPFDPRAVFIDTSRIPELLHCTFSKKDGGINIGGAVTIARLIQAADDFAHRWKDNRPESLGAMSAILRMVGNTHLRNAATVSGNLMLTHRQAGTADPFPSDVFTALAAVGATVYLVSSKWPKRAFTMMDFVTAKLPPDAILTGIFIPAGEPDEHCRVYKVGRRRQNAHSIVNAGFRVRMAGRIAKKQELTIVLAGVTATPWRALKTEAFLAGKPWTGQTLSAALPIFESELNASITTLHEDVSQIYRASLARSLFYRFFLHVASEVNPSEVAPIVASGSEQMEIPLSRGSEEFEVFPSEFPVSEPIVKLTAFTQATGEARYVHDIPVPPRTLHGFLVLSTESNASFDWKPGIDQLIEWTVKHYKGVHDILTVRDIANPDNNMAGIGNDDPYFAPGVVTRAGQPLAVVLAETELQAQAAASYIQANCVVYKDKKKPVLTMKDALALPNKKGLFEQAPKSAAFLTYFDTLKRPGSSEEWLKHPARPVDGLQVAQGNQRTGEQAHFYMETQAALAIPGEGGTMMVHTGTQSLDAVQGSVARILGIPVNAVTVGVGLLGGGFGGKTTRVPFYAVPAAIGAHKHRRPVRILLNREVDTRVMGRRHPVDGHYDVLFGDDGRVHGYKSLTYADGGNTYDCTFFILDEMQFNGDSAYMIPTYQTDLYAYRTNKPSNTAMRSFGVTQAAMVREAAMERVAHALGILPETVREKNLYRTGTATDFDVTPYNEPLKDCDIRGVWKLMKEKSSFVERERLVREFNGKNKWRKRGISMIPLKYGIAYTRRMLNQGRAIINVYHEDGSLLLMHGGVEIGQGIHTKMAQICAEGLNIPIGLIRVPDTNTRAVGNATSTGASTGADLNGVAVHKAAVQLRKRLEEFCYERREKLGERKCIELGIDFWRHKEGWRAKVKLKGSKTPSLIWVNVVGQAFNERIDLTSEAFYKTPHLSQISPEHPLGRPYFYFTYGASCTEVEIDVLTGESMIVRADVIYENAKSLNPAIDIGQVQGSFVQCIGNMTTEEVLLDKDGRLVSFGTWDYKPPTSMSIPRDFRVTLLERAPITQQAENVIDQAALLEQRHEKGAVVGHTAAQSSRTVGEPPFVLGTSVFFAIKHAVAAARKDRGDTTWFELDAPATVQRIQQACEVTQASLVLDPPTPKTMAAGAVKA